jgi:cytochrome c oxidase subunit 1
VSTAQRPVGPTPSHAKTSPRASIRQPGWYRAGLCTAIALGLSFALSFGARAGLGYDPFLSGDSVTRIALLIMPFGFLFGLGTFDFWFAWAAGKPTPEEDHSGHGATSWKSYFLPNTDHKVIGIQYTVLSFFWLFVGGLMAMLVRAELAAPGASSWTPTPTTASSASTRRCSSSCSSSRSSRGWRTTSSRS